MIDLERRRSEALRPRGAATVRSAKEAERFLDRVGIALRYGPGKTLPLASMFDATSGGSDGPFVLAAELTNHLLGTGIAIEVSVIAGRLSLVHRSLVPAVYALVRRGRPAGDLSGLGLNARRAFTLLQTRREATAGEVRAYLGAKFAERHDPAYDALAELSRLMIVDRGPYEINPKGIHYLSKDGYPHHLFHDAHMDLARAAARLSMEDAADAVVERYVRGAVFCAVRTMKSMFKAFLVAEEIDLALDRLARAGSITVSKMERQQVAVAVAAKRR